MNKKLISLLLALTACCALAGTTACGEDDVASSSTSSSSESNVELDENSSLSGVSSNEDEEESSVVSGDESSVSEGDEVSSSDDDQNADSSSGSNADSSDDEPKGTQGLKYGADYNSNFTEVIGWTVEGIGTATDAEIVIPDLYEGKPVTGVKYNAFKGNAQITSVTMGDGVTTLGTGAFGECSSLREIRLSEKLTTIGWSAFSECTELTEIVLPDSVTTLGDRAFSECTKLKNVTLSNGLTKFGESVFYDCEALEFNEYDNALYLGSKQNKYLLLAQATNTSIDSCTIHANTKFIYEYAFLDCRRLPEITIPASVKAIGQQAFYWCENLKTVTIDDLAAWCAVDFADDYSNPLTDASRLLIDGNEVVHLVIPEGVTEIKARAFTCFDPMLSLTLPDGVTTIGEDAFTYCYGLQEVTLPNSLIAVGEGSFAGCPVHNDYEGGYYLGNQSNPYLVLIGVDYELASLTLHADTEIIAGKALEDRYYLENVVISANVKYVGANAFSGCENLTSVTFQNPDGWYQADDLDFPVSGLDDPLFCGNRTDGRRAFRERMDSHRRITNHREKDEARCSRNGL